MKVNALLAGVEAAKSDHVELDAEGGAEATSPNTRYLSTGVTMTLAATSVGAIGDSYDLDRSAGGGAGFKLVGIAVGGFVHSQPLGMAMGAYGAGRSIYVNFLGRGRDLVFPKNTAMDISVGIRPEHPPATPKNPESAPIS